MTPKRYERLCQQFDQAQGRAADERAADPALAADLQRVLAADCRDRGDRLLQQSCPVNARALPSAEPPTVPAAGPDAPAPWPGRLAPR
jgi:hypothetical protein